MWCTSICSAARMWCPFRCGCPAEVAKPLLEDGRFLQPHRSYVVNLAAAQLLTAGELQMCSGARIPIPRGREGAVREAFRSWIDR